MLHAWLSSIVILDLTQWLCWNNELQVNDMYKHYRSLGRTSQAKFTHSLSYPRVPSRTVHARPLLSVQSEGGSINRRPCSTDSAKLKSITPLPVRRRKTKVVEGNSSDESGGEEVIVRIDSPSTLSFHHASGGLFPPK